MRQWVSVLSLAIAIGLAAVTPAGAQQGTSEMRGRVIDAQNAAVPGATVVAKNENTGMFREVVTAPDGSYFMSALTPGSYEMSATLPGFKKYRRSGIRLEVGKTQTVDVTLEVGGIEEAVTVSGESPLVDVTSKEIGGSVQQQEMNDIPSINRNFTSYLSLLPGITATISTDSFGADSVSVNGQNVRNVNYTFDGAGNNDTFNAGNGGAQARIPVEAVQEFQLLTSQFDAEFGSSAGGVVNAVSRQGTNTLHGTAFFFDQNDAMTTRTYFAEKQNLNKPDTRQVQWGGWVGGPVVRDKLHFFANLERIDQNRGVTINIPARSELNFTDFTHDNVWNWMVRMDHQINGNNTWAVRWLRESSPQSNQFPGVTNWTSSRAEQENDVDWTIVGTLNSVIKSTKVNVLKLSYTHEDVFFGNPGYFATGNQVDLAPVLQHQTFEDGISSRANRRMDPSYQLDETFSWYLPGKRGDHDLKFGVNYVYMPLRIFDASNQNGTFRFSSSDLDFDPNNPRTYPDRLQIRVPGVSDFETQGHTVGVYAQDKWRVNRRLTVSAGLRYDVEVIPLEEKDNPSFPDPSKYPVDKNNISPRVGATWVLDDASTSVIRGGWGLYFQKTPYSFFTAITSSGVFSDSFVVLLPAAGIDPGPSQGRLPTNPYLINGPVVNRALLAADFPPGTLQKNAGTVQFDNPNRHLPYSRQASIGYERQLAGNIAVSADYIHTELRDLYMRRDLNYGQRTSTSRTAPYVRINSNFAGPVREIINSGRTDYDALQLSFQKRFSRGYSFRGSYTYSQSFGNTASAGNIEDITTQVLDQLNLEQGESVTTNDRPHILSIDGSLLVPKTKGMIVSGVLQYQSGTPYTLTDSTTDPDRNNFAQEPLPAGTYSGDPNRADAITVVNKGGFRGVRGPDYFLVSMRAGYRFQLRGGRALQAHIDVFNVTNRANFNNPNGDRFDAATFLILRSILNGGPTRTAQFNLKYTF